MKKYYLLFILFLIISPCLLMAQSIRKIQIAGTVMDSFTGVGIPKAKVTLMQQDSVVVDTATVKTIYPNGIMISTVYSFDVPAQTSTYILKAEAENFETGYITFSLKRLKRQVKLEIPDIKLKKQKKKAYGLNEENALDEVVVKATKIKMYYKGDTLVYNADAFNLPEGSMLDGLIKQMPGATIEDGQIRINGRIIDYLTLNGKKLFDGKSQLLVNNLPYYTVKNLKVFEQNKEEDATLNLESSVKDYVMDVSLKREYNSNNFGNAKVGVGTKDRMLARIFDSFISEKWSSFVYGNFNNLNQTRTPGGDGNFSDASSPKSDIETKQFGMSGQYERNQGRFRENFSLSGDIQKVGQDMQQSQELFYPDGNVFKTLQEKSDKRISNFEFKNNLTWRKPFWLSAKTEVKYDDGKNRLTNQGSTFEDALVNQTEKEFLSKFHSFNLHQYIDYMTVTDWGDRFGVQAKAGYQSGRDRSNENQCIVYPREDVDSLYEYLANEKVKKESYNYSLLGVYQYELLGGKRIAVQYAYEQSNELADRFRLRNEVDDNSYHANTLRRMHTPSLFFDYKKGYWKTILQMDMNFETDKMSYSRNASNLLLKRDYVDFNPKFTIYRQTKKDMILFVSNFGTVKKPSVLDLVEYVDDSDPLIVTTGNENLKKSKRWHSDIQYTYFYSRGFWMDMVGQLDFYYDNIIHSSLYNEQTGSYMLRPENVKGSWQAGYFCNLTCNVAKQLSLRSNFSYDFSHKIGLSGTTSTSLQRNEINTHTVNETLKLTYQYKTFTASFIGGMKYQGARCETSDNMNYNAYDFHYGASMNCYLPWKIQIAADLTMYQRKGYELASINRDNLIGNVSLNRSFAKGKLLVSVVAYDVFHQLSSTEKMISDLSNTETSYNCIPRYGMISLTYKFGKK